MALLSRVDVLRKVAVFDDGRTINVPEFINIIEDSISSNYYTLTYTDEAPNDCLIQRAIILRWTTTINFRKIIKSFSLPIGAKT